MVGKSLCGPVGFTLFWNMDFSVLLKMPASGYGAEKEVI